ncbi:hypothetical protein HMPREF1569_0060 [Klebsiella oxytoca OK-1]|nr:hypothetical protein HMPREF1569_0060 [Klebsiella oxytoca OK-1]
MTGLRVYRRLGAGSPDRCAASPPGNMPGLIIRHRFLACAALRRATGLPASVILSPG